METETIAITVTAKQLDGGAEEQERDIVSMMLYVKDRYGSAYHEMAKLCRDMPRHYKVKQKNLTLYQP